MNHFIKHRAKIETAVMLGLFAAIVYWMGRPPAKAPPADQVQVFEVERLIGARLASSSLQKPTLLVFWATWCPPCKVELARLQRLVSFGVISPDSVLAVSVGEDRETVAKAAEDRGYTFQVALDTQSLVSRLYAVNGTPTVLLRNADGTVAWRTSGISPTLELRALFYLSGK